MINIWVRYLKKRVREGFNIWQKHKFMEYYVMKGEIFHKVKVLIDLGISKDLFVGIKELSSFVPLWMSPIRQKSILYIKIQMSENMKNGYLLKYSSFWSLCHFDFLIIIKMSTIFMQAHINTSSFYLPLLLQYISVLSLFLCILSCHVLVVILMRI